MYFCPGAVPFCLLYIIVKYFIVYYSIVFNFVGGAMEWDNRAPRVPGCLFYSIWWCNIVCFSTLYQIIVYYSVYSILLYVLVYSRVVGL